MITRERSLHSSLPATPQPASSESSIEPELPVISKFSFRFAASALSGAAIFACFPRPGWHLLVWVACLPILLTLVTERSLPRAFLWGYVCGALFLAGSCYWFVEVMERYGKLAPPLAAGVLLLFVAVFSGFFGAFGLAEGWVARRMPLAALALSPLLWVSMELARTYLITGFPWNLTGYAVQAEGLRQLASVTAVYGLSFLAVATSAMAAWALLERQRTRARVGLALWLGMLIAANWLARPPALRPGSRAAFLVQPNVPLDESVQEAWAPWRDPGPLNSLVALTLGGRAVDEAAIGPPLIVWAENPAPFYFNRDPVFRGAIEGMARGARGYVVVNTVTFADPENKLPKNSAVVLDPEGRLLLQYDKIHLVPFGEYVPWWAFPGRVGKIAAEAGNFVPGSSYQVARTPEGAVGIFICYEAIFPQLVRRIVSEGAGVLVNVSNDAWYGDSPAAFQHLEMARLRAIENRRTLLRATNDGITAMIDPYGRVTSELPRRRRLVLAGRFDYLTERTFYARHGDVFAWLCATVAAGIAAVRALARGKREA